MLVIFTPSVALSYGLSSYSSSVLIFYKNFYVDSITTFLYIHVMYFEHIFLPPSLFSLPPPTGCSTLQKSPFYVRVLFFPDLDFTYQRKHVVFVFPSLTYFTWHDDGSITLHSVYLPHFFPFEWCILIVLRSFTVMFPYVHIMYLDQIHLLYYSFLFSLYPF
jgi:hypothetical protein